MIRLHEVTKKTRRQAAVECLSLHVPEGSIYGLVDSDRGRRHMIMNLCAGILWPDTGEIYIGGRLISGKTDCLAALKKVGYMPDRNTADPGQTAAEFLEFYARAGGEHGLSAREHCRELLQAGGMETRADVLCSSLPPSVRRLLEFLRVLVQRPRILLLEEPFLGMDPREKAKMKEILQELAVDGVTTMVSLDSLNEAMLLCDTLGVINQGKIEAEGEREAVLLKLRADAPLYIDVRTDPFKAAEFLRAVPQVQSIAWQGRHFRVIFSGTEDEEAKLLCELLDAGILVNSFSRRTD